MKKFGSLGELLKDYRKLNKVSQSDLSARLNVDNRTLIRWENNETLIKPEKEEELVEETFIPYQVIRNLNATVAIPTYYDFSIRKYSYSELSNELPEASWLKAQINLDSTRTRPINTTSDVDHLKRFIDFLYAPLVTLPHETIITATNILPELNQVLFDTSGYYAGHCVIFPLKKKIYEQIKAKKMSEEEIDSTCFTSEIDVKETVFYCYNINADCNENTFYILCPVLKYFNDSRHFDYTFANYVLRPDGFKLMEEIGMKLLWEDIERKFHRGLVVSPRFYEGNFKEFLAE